MHTQKGITYSSDLYERTYLVPIRLKKDLALTMSTACPEATTKCQIIPENDSNHNLMYEAIF